MMRARAYTLVELVAALGVASVLVLAMTSAMQWVGRALPDAKQGSSGIVAAQTGLDQFLADLRFATAVSERTATALTLTVPDQTGDGVDETIRYAWSGVAGEPLNRKYRNAQRATVIQSVRSLAFTYDLAATQSPGADAPSSEQTFVSNGGTLTPVAYAITSSGWCGQAFRPSLPSSATKWQITRVRFRARQHGALGGITAVQLQTATTDGTPKGTVLAEVQVLENKLSAAFDWVEVVFPNYPPIDKGEWTCLVFKHVQDADACDIESSLIALPLTAAAWVETGNGAMSWTTNALKSTSLYAWGRYYQDGAAVTTTRLRGVKLTASVGRVAPKPLEVSAGLLNQPVVTP